MIEPTRVEARDGYCIYIEFDDGEAGEVDLSHLAGRGVFAAWEDRTFFENVYIVPPRTIAWGNGLDLCPDALYMRLTGKSLADIGWGVSA